MNIVREVLLEIKVPFIQKSKLCVGDNHYTVAWLKPHSALFYFLSTHL